MRLFLGIPTAGSPSQPFLNSLAHIDLPANLAAFERGVVTGNFVPAQRDVLFERALRWRADTIVMCDDDMILPKHAVTSLCALLASDPQIALAGALYYSRDGLRPMVVDGWDPRDTGSGWIPAFDDRTPVAVGGVGFGCVAIRVAAVEPFARPLFAAQIYIEASAGRVRVCNEDYLFCNRLATAGYATFLHPGVRCGHYDRARDRVAPDAWESVESSNRKRVLARTGERFALMKLEDAPPATSAERHVRADVDYVEAEELQS